MDRRPAIVPDADLGFWPAGKRLSPPRGRDRPLDRSRLVKLLNSTKARLILVRAPAGFGKTTLLQQWYDLLSDQEQHCAWLTLAEEDNDVARLLVVLAAALNLSSDPTREAGGGASALFARLRGSIDQSSTRTVLFLDEVNAITDPDALEVLRCLVASAEARFLVVVSGRSVPMLGQSRLKLSGELIEVTEDDLRFQFEEAASFFASRIGTFIGRDNIERAQAQADGWAAALQLAALSLRDRPNAEAFLSAMESFDGDLAQYLHENVLATQTEEVRQFLMAVSPFREITGGLCDAVTARTNSSVMLAELDQAGLFLKRVGVDESAIWYRFHDLFAQFLRGQLQLHADSSRIADIRRAGARWFADRGLWEDAAYHWLAVGDRKAALSNLESIAMLHISRGLLNTVLGWGKFLQADDAAAYPQLYCACLWAELFRGKNIISAQRLDEFRRLLPQNQALSPYLHDSVSSLAVMIATTKMDYETVRRIGPSALHDMIRPDSWEASAVANCLTAAYLGCLDLRKAWQTLEMAKNSCRESNRPLNRVYAAALEGMLYWCDLRLVDATVTLRTAYEEAVAEQGASSHAASLAAVPYALVLYESDRLEEAASLLQGRSAAIAEGAIPDFIAIAGLVEARIAAARGHFAQAKRILVEADVMCSRYEMQRIVEPLRWERAYLCSLAGDDIEFDRLCSNLRFKDDSFAGHDRSLSDLVARDIAMLRVALLREGAATVLARVEILKLEAEKKGLRQRELMLLIVRTQALVSLGHTDAALVEMIQALNLSLKSGFLRCVIDAGEELQPVIRAAEQYFLNASHETRGAYRALVGRLDERRAHDPTPSGTFRLNAASRAALSPRELEIIDIAARGLTNREIAEALSLTERTVKWHLRNAFSKLGVSNRTEAVFLTRVS